MGVHQLVVLAEIRSLIIGWGNHAQPSLLRNGVVLGPKLGLLHQEGERPRSERRIGERGPSDVRSVDQLHDAGAAVRRSPLRNYRYRPRILQAIITSQFFFEPAVIVVEIVEERGDIPREVERRGFELEIDGRENRPRSRWLGV